MSDTPKPPIPEPTPIPNPPGPAPTLTDPPVAATQAAPIFYSTVAKAEGRMTHR